MSLNANAERIGALSFACKTKEDLYVLTMAIITPDVELVSYLYEKKGCLIFKEDTKVKILKDEGDFLKVLIASDYVGYIYKSHLK